MTDTEADDLYRQLKAADEAEQPCLVVELSRVLLKEFDWDIVWLLQGQNLYSLGRYVEAEASLLNALRTAKDKHQAIVLAHLGHMERQRGRFAFAEAWYRQAIELAPSEAGFRIFLGGLLASQGDFEQAERVHRQAIQCPHGCVDEAHFNLWLVLRAQERFEEAVAALDRALEITPDYARALDAKRDIELALAMRASLRPSPAIPH